MGRSRRRRHARIRRAWRRLSVRQAAKQAGIRGGGLKTLLAGALALELAVGVRQAWQEQGMALSLIRQEETCRVELVRQLDGSGTEPGNGPGIGTLGRSGKARAPGRSTGSVWIRRPWRSRCTTICRKPVRLAKMIRMRENNQGNLEKILLRLSGSCIILSDERS